MAVSTIVSTHLHPPARLKCCLAARLNTLLLLVAVAVARNEVEVAVQVACLQDQFKLQHSLTPLQLELVVAAALPDLIMRPMGKIHLLLG
jgi:hypothetical protein